MSKPGVKSFFGQINFIRRFVPDFSEITKEGKASFRQIKSAIANAPTLSYPDFSKDFHLY